MTQKSPFAQNTHFDNDYQEISGPTFSSPCRLSSCPRWHGQKQKKQKPRWERTGQRRDNLPPTLPNCTVAGPPNNQGGGGREPNVTMGVAEDLPLSSLCITCRKLSTAIGQQARRSITLPLQPLFHSPSQFPFLLKEKNKTKDTRDVGLSSRN